VDIIINLTFVMLRSWTETWSYWPPSKTRNCWSNSNLNWN